MERESTLFRIQDINDSKNKKLLYCAMVRTILVLLATLILIPLVAWKYGTPLMPEQVHMLMMSIRIMLITAVSCFIVSELTRNCSQVDKLWSTIPIVYVWYFAYASDWHLRSVLMAILVTLWGIRLTYNFSRRGGYHWVPWKGHEDYRWEVLRQNPALQGRWRWALFNLFFISLYQQSLILLFTLPAILAGFGKKSLGWLDVVAALCFIFFLITETVADQQQYNFQEEKHRRLRNQETLEMPYARGFIWEGLWKIVRHPNYASEQAIWISFYLFSVAASGEWLNWSLTGSILLILLFLGSSNFSEEISAKKYPAYQDYQQKVPRFIPFLKK
jgi:steroid 5-alpha reductase family enzyme